MNKELSDKTVTVVEPKEDKIQFSGLFLLECGEVLHQPTFAFQTWGFEANSSKKTVWVCHALTGSQFVQEWWRGLFGSGCYFDPADWQIICVNVLGSCYGTEGPIDATHPERSLYLNFPLVTIRDMVKGLDFVRNHLNINSIDVLIGASVGGQQALEWAVQQPSLFKTIIPIATNAKHSPFGIAFNASQRLALTADASFEEATSPQGGSRGLIAARSIGMLSYRTYEGYEITQREEVSKLDDFKASSYQKYQGEKLLRRFNAYSYWYLSKAMDSHDLGRNRVSIEAALHEINCPALVIGIDSDLLFPIQEQVYLAKTIKNATLVQLQSKFGHDGFLVEFEPLEKAIRSFITNNL